ncbi:hypothetical protein BKA56DRAFT_695187 [Ilyonectria sp. MPI-CAGE-AT-0026]|nr:hypothetical protein BKA56DRAFT_695187 [Ilyonectria sp. MPI-CAGE-AT-0026]
MTYQPTAAELAAHTFEFDSATLDKPLADFLQKFYTLSDDRENANSWAACFIEDATMKRKTADAVGRDAIAEINIGSWEGQASRLHVVYKVFPFAAGSPQEVMVYGLSKYWYEDGTTGQMPWAARLHFQRSQEDIAIDFYQIYAIKHD